MSFSYLAFLALFLSVSQTGDIAFAEQQAIDVTAFDGLKLDGTLTLPLGSPRGALLILPGSGNVSADGDVSSPLVGFPQGSNTSAKLSEQLANTLTRAGFVTLRYTKRGYTPNPAEAIAQPMPLLLKDAESAFKALKKQYSGLPIGVVGLSEGALLASMLAGKLTEIKALFLLSLPTRTIDAVLVREFVQWPVEIVRQRLDADRDGILSKAELEKLNEKDRFPFAGNPPLSGATVLDVDQNGDGMISIVDELLPRYQALYQKVVLPILQLPPYLNWYRSLKDGPKFSEIASKVKAPVYLYQGMDDAHLDWSWVVSSQHFFSGKSSLRLFPGLGHCLAPADGTFGEFKTSGPLANEVLTAVASDVKNAF